MANPKIVSGPNKWALILALFEPDQSNCVNFEFDDRDRVRNSTFVSVESATRLDGDGNEWNLVCWIPFSDGYHMKIRYSCHTRKGELLESWQDEDLEEIDNQMDKTDREHYRS